MNLDSFGIPQKLVEALKEFHHRDLSGDIIVRFDRGRAVKIETRAVEALRDSAHASAYLTGNGKTP